MSEKGQRFVAINAHKNYVVVGAVDGEQTVVLSPRRVPIGELDEWAAAHLFQPPDQKVQT